MNTFAWLLLFVDTTIYYGKHYELKLFKCLPKSGEVFEIYSDNKDWKNRLIIFFFIFLLLCAFVFCKICKLSVKIPKSHRKGKAHRGPKISVSTVSIKRKQVQIVYRVSSSPTPKK